MGMHVTLIMCALVATVRTQESFNTTPPPVTSNFSCSGRQMGFYADVETNCRAYHTCDDHGNHFTHYCPEDTAFRQDAMICDHAYLVDCRANVDSASTRLRIDLDNNHDAPPSSFVEPRGEGTNTRGYARSFRINPATKSSSSTKYPTFVLNSSVFLTDRESKVKRPNSSNRFRESENQSTRTSAKNYKGDAITTQQSHATSKIVVSTTPKISLSEDLQPPSDTPRASKIINNNYQDDEFSFLLPPPVRNDNVDYQKTTFESLKTDDTKSFQKITSRPSKFDDDSKLHSSREPVFSTNSFDSVTFSPRTNMVLDMLKAKQLGRESNFHISRPVNFLEPPFFKSELPAFSRTNFNFRNDDYPYVETLRSIQNNKPSTNSIFSSASTKLTTKTESTTTTSTEASIFAVPTKPLHSFADVENDPYYPKTPVTTEAYYTPRHRTDKPNKAHFTTTRRPATTTAKFEIPAVLPDLNSLEDLLDRRKLFFIPRIKSV